MRIRHYAVALACLSLAPVASSQPPGQDVRALAAFQDALQQDGFDVNPGAVFRVNLVDAWCNNTLPSWIPFDHALYSNSQPYLAPAVPKSASESKTIFPLFKLGPEEAIVIIGQTPPPERYFGFYAFLRTRVSADGTRQPLWATVGDSVNNLTVRTTGRSPFDTSVAVIFTPDQGTDARIRAALQRAGYPAAIINTVPFPASILNLGHGDAADEFLIAVRNAMWQVQAEGDAYMANPPLQVFRVTPRTEAVANPFQPRLRVRGTGQTEVELTHKLGLLRERIIAANASANLHHRDLATQTTAYEGYDYMQRGADPWGDSRDAMFLTGGFVPEFGANDVVTLADDEFLMVYGVNHVATGKASYHSVNIYASAEGKVPIGPVEDPAFVDSAATYLPDDPAAARLMYAIKFSRSCGRGEPYCVSLGIDNCSRLTVGPSTVLGLFVRMYLEPATKVGPAMPEILYDRVLKFSPRPQTTP